MSSLREPKAVFYNASDFKAVTDIYPVKLLVESMDWDEIGGPKMADITATGGRRDMLNLAGLLGCAVDIFTPWGPGWWGQVYSVTIHLSGMDVTFTLDGMHNRVAVAYSYVDAGAPQGGIRKTTAYSQSSESVADWGTHEFLYSANNLTDAAAAAQRAILLAACKWPMGGASLTGTGGKVSATITCKGWWETLLWRMASVPAQISVSYTTTSTTTQAVGTGAHNQKVMQQFTVGSADIHVIQVDIYARKSGSPDDNLQLDIYALDGSGNPTGDSLTSGSLPGYTLTTSLAWVTIDVSEVTLSASTQYAIVLNRGAADGSNYFLINVNTDLGYSGGVFKIYDATWNPRSPDADMPFRVYINPQVENTQQVANLVATYGQYFQGVIVEDVSEHITGAYRDGDTTVQAEIMELLKVGGPDDRKYMIDVTRDRYLVIQQRPAESAPFYWLTERGVIMERGMKANTFDHMTGCWVGSADFPYSTAVINAQYPDLQFVAGASWARGQGIQPRFEGMPGPDELLMVYA